MKNSIFILSFLIFGFAHAQVCAKIWQKTFYRGDAVILNDKTIISDLETDPILKNWNDTISAIWVAKNCQLMAFEDKNGAGYAVYWVQGKYFWAGTMNNKISSLACFCTQN